MGRSSSGRVRAMVRVRVRAMVRVRVRVRVWVWVWVWRDVFPHADAQCINTQRMHTNLITSAL